MGKSPISIAIFNSKLLVITRGYPFPPQAAQAAFAHVVAATVPQLAGLVLAGAGAAGHGRAEGALLGGHLHLTSVETWGFLWFLGQKW